MDTSLKRKNYSAGRGGLASDHLTEAFVACIEDPNSSPWYSALEDNDVLSFFRPEMQRRWTAMSLKERGRWLLGQLWNCSDIMPGSLCDDLELRHGRTYAVAARELKAWSSQLLAGACREINWKEAIAENEPS